MNLKFIDIHTFHLERRSSDRNNKTNLKPLKHTMNLLFTTGIYPSSYKESTVVPIYKQRDKFNLTNFRHVSLIPTFVQIIESI